MSKFIPRPPQKTECITLRINKKKLDILNEISKEKSISRNRIIEQCINFALENLHTEN